MRGRYPGPYQYKDINRYFAAVARLDEEFGTTPRYNIAPTQLAPIIREDEDGRFFDMLRWGLIPHWAKDVSIGNRMINARAETLLEKPSFRKPFERQRCLVPAGGFYEWRKGESSRQPYLIRRRDRAPVAFAGLWEHWVNPESKEPVETFTIVTTTANELTQPIHSRMPLILSPAHFDEWLASDEPPVELLATPETPEFEAVPVSTWVNSTRHDDPRCMEPTETN